MSLLRNYIKDLQKSKSTPLLIELSKKDLDLMSKEDKSGLNISSYVAKEIYDRDMKDTGETNVIYIDADKAGDLDHIYLLEEFLERITDQVKGIKNLNIAKEGISKGLSFATGGLLDSVFGGFIDQGVDFVVDISNGFADILVEQVEISDKILGTAEEKIHEVINNISINFLDEIQNNKICLSPDAKKAIAELSKEFKKELTAAESFRLILQLMLSVAIDNPKILFINNPHKLDKNSLAILSMLFSFSKDAKDQEKHTGLSVVYAYEDEAFQPYSEVKEEFKQSKMLLDEQRRFTQRYAMLERPTSDIPHIAVKSTMFVGRQEELENLNARYHYSQEHKEVATLEVISGDPGVGKTKLIKKHLEKIKPKEGQGTKQIQLTLLNQVGHTSTNTGIGSLIDSIVKEAQRLENAKKWNEKVIDTIAEKAKDGVLGFIKNALGVDALIDVGTALIDRVETDTQIKQIQHNTMGEQDNKAQDKKEEQFANLNRAIKKLQKLSDDSMPIVLFIDDLQWIDEDSAEYIIKHFIKAFNVHMVASIRPSDATTMLKQAYDNKGLNPYKVALLKEVGIKISDNEHEIVIDSDINIQNIEPNATHLLGLDSITLSSLISQVIKPIDNDDTKQKILATTIINKLNNDKNKDEVNTLFAVETINMLCDQKLYEADSIERLILTDMPLRFNTELTDFKASLEKTFTMLHDKYQTAFEHINTDKKFEQKFNLMAYAVLEERLHILKIYFGKHGNAAVNTLLFSSLLGTPFNSTIVKNILEAIPNTDEELLQPLKKYILEGNEEVSLNETHYEIIEEVYEILSRYQAFNSAYEHRHSLLNIFLDKQLEYQLDDVFKEDNKDAKNSLYTLVLKKIKEEEEQQDFYEKHESGLNSKQYENMIFYKQAYLNVCKKGYQSDPGLWVTFYTGRLSNLAYLYSDQKRFFDAIALEEKSLAIREKLYKDNPKHWAEDYTKSISALAFLYSSQDRLPEAIALNEKALAIREKLYKDTPKQCAEDYAISLSNLAAVYREHNRLPEAIALSERSLVIIEKYYENDPAFWAKYYTIFLSNLAAMYQEQDRFLEATELSERSLVIIEKFYKEEPKRWSGEYTLSLSNLASSYRSQNRVNEAITLHERVLAIRETLYEENPKIWVGEYTLSLTNLADLYKKQDRHLEAIALDEKALSIREKLYKDDPRHWAEKYTISLRSLAEIYGKQDRLPEAIVLYERALTIREMLYKDDPKHWVEYYIDSLNDLASIYKDEDRLSEAITLDEKSIAILEKLYEEDPEFLTEQYAMSLIRLAVVYQKQNRMSEAIVLFEKGLVILEKLYKDDPKGVVAELYISSLIAFAGSLSGLADSYKEQNRVSEAIEVFERSLAILEPLSEENNERWAERYTNTLERLLFLYYHENRLPETVALYERSLSILETLYKDDPNRWAKNYLNSLNNLGSLYNQDRFSEAVALYKRSIDILEKLYKDDPNGWAEDYIASLNDLAVSYKEQNQLTEAIVLFEKSLAILEPLYEENPEYWAEEYKLSLDALAGSLNNLAYLYYEQNRMSEMRVLSERSLAILERLYKDDPSRWAEEYIINLNNVTIALRDSGEIQEAAKYANIIIEICEDYNMQESLAYQNARNLIPKEDNNSSDTMSELLKLIEEHMGSIEYTEPFLTLLYIAKGLSITHNNAEEITERELYYALNFVVLNQKAEYVFREIFGEALDDLNKEIDGELLILLAKSYPTIKYSQAIKELITELKGIFEDELILNIRK